MCVHVHTSLIWRQAVVSLHHFLVSLVRKRHYIEAFLFSDLPSVLVFFFFFFFLRSKVFCIWVMPAFCWHMLILQIGSMSNCVRLKRSYRLSLVIQSLNISLGSFANNCDYVSSFEQGMKRKEGREKYVFSYWSKIQVTFSVAGTSYDSTDPNVSLVHSGYECGP